MQLCDILNSIKKVMYKVKYCEDCNIILYPDLSEYRLINSHIKTIISFELYLHVLTFLRHSNAVIAMIIEYLTQLSYKSGVQVKSPRNVAQDIYRCVLTVAVGVISESDLNNCVCPTCGKFPAITFSDGNMKNAS